MAAAEGNLPYDGSSLCLCGSDGKGAVLFTGRHVESGYPVYDVNDLYYSHSRSSL